MLWGWIYSAYVYHYSFYSPEDFPRTKFRDMVSTDYFSFRLSTFNFLQVAWRPRSVYIVNYLLFDETSYPSSITKTWYLQTTLNSLNVGQNWTQWENWSPNNILIHLCQLWLTGISQSHSSKILSLSVSLSLFLSQTLSVFFPLIGAWGTFIL